MSVQRLLLVCLRGSVEFRPSLWDIQGQTRLQLGHLYAWSRWLDRSRHKANFGENQLSLYSDTCPVCISCSSVFSSVGVIYGSVTLGYPFLPIGHWLLFPAASSPLFICLPFDFSSQRLLLQNSRGLIFTRCRQQQKKRKEMQFLQTASKPHLEMVWNVIYNRISTDVASVRALWVLTSYYKASFSVTMSLKCRDLHNPNVKVLPYPSQQRPWHTTPRCEREKWRGKAKW